MAYVYKHFIPQNIAPKGAKNIGVYDSNGKLVCSIPLGRLAPPTSQKQYSVGLVSDVHCYHSATVWHPSEKFDVALTHFENEGCLFVCNSGDLTQTGFFNEGDTTTLVTGQFGSYKQVCDSHTIRVYELCGNHESYVKPITNNLTELKNYTDAEMYYSVAHGDDMYLFLSQPAGSVPMTDEALQWLYETLEENRNRRCFVFIHPHLKDDSGNALGVYTTNQFFTNWKSTAAFKNLLSHYRNTILFHGHSHMMLECQEVDETANYTEKNGFRSVHIPSLTRPCAIIDGVRTYQNEKSYAYIMDVYADCIVLNGLDLIANKAVPIGTYRINTTLQTIPAGTFTDSTGTITT